MQRYNYTGPLDPDLFYYKQFKHNNLLLVGAFNFIESPIENPKGAIFCGFDATSAKLIGGTANLTLP